MKKQRKKGHTFSALAQLLQCLFEVAQKFADMEEGERAIWEEEREYQWWGERDK